MRVQRFSGSLAQNHRPTSDLCQHSAPLEAWSSVVDGERSSGPRFEGQTGEVC